jgi:hypothetical protein
MANKKTKTAIPFEGWEHPHFVAVPSNFFDFHLSDFKSLAELKVLLYLFRRTLGFGRQEDDISISQMVNGLRSQEGRILDKGTGLGKRSVLMAIRSLLKRGMIEKRINESNEKGHLPSTYKLRMRQSQLDLPLGD